MVHSVKVKKLTMHPKAREAIQGFPEDVKDRMGFALREIQKGYVLGMPRSRSMPTLGMRAAELRIRGEDGIYRTFYYTKAEEAVLVFHAFVKKTQKTPVLEIELGKKRLKELLNEKS